ncbi:primosomal protein N' [Paenibacillus thiaminolyticus]|uniref:primosomal protein N' n=1 Tax=Paenibacillus thiaminolyticus TaxID=49283 RepID=UPI00232CDF51|nr:primosomal protein N' [Paenibacillus thiaminolyticus]WCF11134.1 primosomal protein N' [Paenibacillus thiaminolyticus]
MRDAVSAGAVGTHPGLPIARVIVDVSVKDTDRPFDYAIPPSMADWIETGSRVGVPFGGRTVQGFVIGLSDRTDVPLSRLKPIQQLLDVIPPLPADLVELGMWMSDRYVCTLTAALQAMIPGAIKGKREKALSLGDDARLFLQGADGGTDELTLRPDRLLEDPQTRSLLAYVQRNEPLPAPKLLQAFPQEARLIKEALQHGWLQETERIKDRIGVKRLKRVTLTVDDVGEAVGRLGSRAGRQQETLRLLEEYGGELPLKSLNASAVKALEGKGYVAVDEVEVMRDPYAQRRFRPSKPLPLTEEQQQVFEALALAVDEQEHRTFLLHGVTGSGKTEVYLQAIERCLDSGREAIVLVPEISLTPQMVERFKGRFGSRVAVMHSRLSQGERYDEWRKIREGRVQVAIGARSAVFAPFPRVGLIIMDEEHESSYKQEETPKYHARDVAIERARRQGAVVVLGSATPSMETYYASRLSGYEQLPAGLEAPPWKLTALAMPSRVGGRPLPPVTIVDMRDQLKLGNRSMFSAPLEAALEQRLERQEQTVLLLNRRGYSTFVMCRSCGYVAQCPECDISLTYHMKTRHMRCHYCGHAERAPEVCPSCESEHIRYFGTGTQRVEEQLARRFPGIRVIRMDVDTTSEKGSHERLLQQFRERKADVLLGTQMVAKGLDFPYVTLVGVIAADSALHMPDFRAAEKTFHLLTQVAGRAGRHDLPGEVIVQTYAPEHYSIIHASGHDYRGFASEELRHRRNLMVPPFCRLALLSMSHEQLPLLVRVAENAAQRLKELAERQGWLLPLHEHAEAMEILGPVASPIPRIKNRYRFQCIIKCRGDVNLSGLLAEAMREFDSIAKEQDVRFSVDIDPQMMM